MSNAMPNLGTSVPSSQFGTYLPLPSIDESVTTGMDDAACPRQTLGKKKVNIKQQKL